MTQARRSILIVDDDDSHRMLVRRALRDLPITLVEATTPDEAHGMMLQQGQSLGLVFLDMNLRGTPGLTVLSAIRAAYPMEKLPVVVLSTSGLENDVHRAYKAGANCYLVKDTDPSEFRFRLARAAAFFLGR